MINKAHTKTTMEVKARFDHFNINVLDLERSIAFYEKALGLHESHRKEAADGSFVLVYLADGVNRIPIGADLASRTLGNL
jgi:Lactoylglutathione lyase and related lyases